MSTKRGGERPFEKHINRSNNFCRLTVAYFYVNGSGIPVCVNAARLCSADDVDSPDSAWRVG